jgi:hypothetical protein
MARNPTFDRRLASCPYDCARSTNKRLQAAKKTWATRLASRAAPASTSPLIYEAERAPIGAHRCRVSSQRRSTVAPPIQSPRPRLRAPDRSQRLLPDIALALSQLRLLASLLQHVRALVETGRQKLVGMRALSACRSIMKPFKRHAASR